MDRERIGEGRVDREEERDREKGEDRRGERIGKGG